MVENRYKPILIISLVATIIVFLSGIFLGWTIDNLKENTVLEDISQSELDLESFIIEQQMIADFNGDTCYLLSSRISELQKQTGKIGYAIENYEQSKSSNVDYNYLKRKHIILNTRLWLLMDQLNKNCGEEQTSIIYFYKQNCRDCLVQGYVLDDLNEELNNSINVFAYDADFEEEPLIILLKEKYDVDIAEIPILIINGETKLEGLSTKEEILFTL